MILVFRAGSSKAEVEHAEQRLKEIGLEPHTLFGVERTVIAAVEYFVNAERAFITLYRSRQDARERNRDDLVTRYTEELAEVVKSTSYAEVIESIRREIGDR